MATSSPTGPSGCESNIVDRLVKCGLWLTLTWSFFVVFLLGFGEYAVKGSLFIVDRLAVVHIGLGVWKRQWWMIWTVGIGAASELGKP